MSTERFDIEVQDKVARSIRSELTAIGQAAINTHSALRDMKTELGGMAGAGSAARSAASGIREEARAANDNARAIKAEIAAIREKTAALEAQARAAREAAGVRGAAAFAPSRAGSPLPPSSGPALGAGAAAAATANGFRVASQAQKEFAGTSQLAAHHSANLVYQLNDIGVSLASGQKPWMVAIQQGSQIAQIQMQAGLSTKGLVVAMLEKLRVVKSVTDAELAGIAATSAAEARALAAAAAQAEAAVMAAEVQTAQALAQQRLATTAAEAAAAEAALTAADEAVAIAAGEAAIANEALAVSQAKAAKDAAKAAETTTTTLTRFGRGGLVGLLALATGYGFAKEAAHALNEETSKSDLTKGLGLTAKEMKKLEDVTITAGDVIHGTFDWLAASIPEGIKDAAEKFKNHLSNNFEAAIQGDKKMVNYIIGSMVGAYHAVIDTWDKLPAAIGDLFFSAVNMAIEAINELIQGSVDGINGFLKSANDALGVDLFGQLAAPQLAKVKNEYAGAAKDVADTTAKAFSDAMKRDYAGEIGDSITSAAKDRLGKQAKDIIDDRPDKKGRTGRHKGATEEEKRAKALADVNRELDSQIELLGYYGDALEQETQFKAISNSLAQKGITLSQEEEAALRGKISTIQEGKRVQSELNKIYEEAVEPGKVYAATIKAITKAEEDHIITAEEAERRRQVAANKLTQDSNPLFAYVKELARAANNVTLYGDALEDAQRAQEMFDKAVAVGLDDAKTGRWQDYLPDAKKDREAKKTTDIFAAIDPKGKEDTNAYILDNYKSLYASIDEMRQQDIGREAEANERKKNLDAALGQARMEMASSVFGQLATLQNSKIKEVAAIGKAAAVAQATIDGIAAVQAALKGPPGPPWSYAIAAATGVSAAANVARIMGIGFQRGGYTGAGGASETAGMVHRNEYVFDALSTQRIGVPALDAMRAGTRLSGAPANDNGGGRAKVSVYPAAGVYTEVRERSDGEIEIIAERVARKVAPGAVAQDMAQPNGRTSKALSSHFGARRNR